MELSIVTTEDNSHTLFVPKLNEHYHSIFGAIQESQHVYIDAGMNYSQKNPVSIFEMGFGTGLNAYLTYQNAKKNNIQVTYHTIDKYPLGNEIISKLNYPNLLGQDKKAYNKMHECSWNAFHLLSSNFKLYKIQADIQDFIFNFNFDIVYFDAFGPDVQPELWEENIFEKIINALNPQGLITTYSAKGKIKRILNKLNMKIETIPGPTGKREMIRAIKIN